MTELVTKYQQYAEYKNTGVSWIPEMPQGWQVTKLKYLIKNLESGVSVNAADYPKSEEEFGVLKTSCVYTREFRAEENKTVFEEELSRVKCPVRAGSIIISRMNTPDLVGAAVYVRENYSKLYLPDRLWQTVYNDDEAQSSKYLHYFMYLRGFRDQISNFAEGASSSMQSISKEDFLSINILLPTRDEQEGVANFLDYETAQIDTLIEKQQTLIKLLKEKRQAIISHAVTKGLNPNALMKDSGVEWLGEVPEHWDVCALKHILATPITDGPHETPVFLDKGVPFISAEAVSQGYINFDKKRAHISKLDNEKYSKKYTPKKYDIYIVKSGATTGVSAIVETDREFNIWSPLAVIRCALYCEPYFTLFAIRSKYFQEEIRLNWNYGTQQNIGMAVLGNLLITYPPRKEAQEISNYLKRVTEKMNELIERAEQAIQLMQERRTALISAAVTGKIDVRGWVAPDSKAM